MEKIYIHTEYIQLDQLLKLASVVQTGGETKFFIENEAICINGEICYQKRKKVYIGDRIQIKDVGEFIVAEEE